MKNNISKLIKCVFYNCTFWSPWADVLGVFSIDVRMSTVYNVVHCVGVVDNAGNNTRIAEEVIGY